MVFGTSRGALFLGPHLQCKLSCVSAPAIAMIRPGSSSNNSSRIHEQLWTSSHCCLQPSPQREANGHVGRAGCAGVGTNSSSGLSALLSSFLLETAHRGHMLRNHEHCLQYLHYIRQTLPYRMEQDVFGFSLQSGGQITGRAGVLDTFHVRKANYVPIRTFQDIRGMQSNHRLLKAGSEFLNPRTEEHSVMQGGQLEVASPKIAQEFDYVVVIDFEATCDKNLQTFQPQEIIEFPSVLVNCQHLTLEDSFQIYVKPVHHPILTDFCTELTGIKQEQVDTGVALMEALDKHDKWLEEKGVKNKNFAVLIWSDWDCKVMLESECRLKGLKKPAYFNRWINLKVLFQDAFVGRKCNLRKAVEVAGLDWNGRAHCGLDDAMNTARLALELMRRGSVLTVTGSLEVLVEDNSVVFVAKLRCPKWPSSSLQVPFGTDPLSSNGSLSKPVNVDVQPLQCHCGVCCKRQMVKKPGPTYGKFFFACGKWSVMKGSGHCSFFQWAHP